MIRGVNSIIGLRSSNSLRRMELTSIHYEMFAPIYGRMKEFNLVCVAFDNIAMSIIWKQISVER